LNVSRDDNEHIYLAVDDKTGDGLSYDCSYNTLKISFGKEEDMNVLYKRFCQYYTYIQKKLRKEGHMLTGMGINPRYAVSGIVCYFITCLLIKSMATVFHFILIRILDYFRVQVRFSLM